LKANGHKEVYSFKTFDEIEAFLRDTLQKDEVLITVGAGEAYKIGEALLK
jgi:UDP-N-acetylmuramate-alanine ligase